MKIQRVRGNNRNILFWVDHDGEVTAEQAIAECQKLTPNLDAYGEWQALPWSICVRWMVFADHYGQPVEIAFGRIFHICLTGEQVAGLADWTPDRPLNDMEQTAYDLCSSGI